MESVCLEKLFSDMANVHNTVSENENTVGSQFYESK